MKSTAIQRVVLTAIFSAIICVTTAFLFHIPVGTAGGYIHLGDAFIYLAGAFLPMPFAMAAAGIGAALADILTGAPHWAIFTFLIKAVMVMCFTDKSDKILCVRNGIASVAAGLIGIMGYYFAEVWMFGNWITPLWSSLTGGTIQAGGGAAVFLLCAAAFDRADIKTKIRRIGS